MAAKKVVVICLVLVPLLFLLTAYLPGWLDDPVKATVTESIGTYRGTIPRYRGTPPGEMTFVVNNDGTWEYHIKDKQGQITYSRAGIWEYGPKQAYIASRPWFKDFEFGFGRYKEDYRLKSGTWMPLFEKRGGVIQICGFPSEPVLSCLRRIEAEPTNRN